MAKIFNLGKSMFNEQLSAGRRALILIAFFCLPFFINLGANSLWDGNEGFYAEPPRELLESGNYLIPTYNYEPRFKKPPFTTWVIASCYSTLGVSEFAERLPAAFAAILLLLLVYSTGRYFLNARVGLAAALMLATMLKFMIYTRQFAGDIFLTLFITTSIVYFARAMLAGDNRKRWQYQLVAYTAIGLGMLDKGLVALVLPIAVVGLFIVLVRRWDMLKLFFNPIGYLIIVALGMSWYLMMYFKYGWTFIRINIIQETFMRFTTDELGGRAFHYYIGVYLAETLPWSLFIIPALVYWYRWLRREFRRLPKIELSACWPLLPVVWFGFIFVFFSLSIGKRANYMIILYPAAALIIGHYFCGELFKTERLLARLHNFMTLLLTAICLAGAAIVLLAYRKLELSTNLIYLPVLVMVLLSSGLIWTLIKRQYEAQMRWLAFMGLALIFSLTLLLPKIEYYRPVPKFAKIVKAEAQATDEVGTYFVDTPSLMFYAERKIFQSWELKDMLHRLDSEHHVYFITREDYLNLLQQNTTIPLQILDSQPLLQLRWGNFIGSNPQPTLKLVLVRKN